MRAFLVGHWFLLALVLGVVSTLLFPAAIHPLTDFWEPRFTIAISLFLVAWTMPTRFLVVELRHPYASLWAIFLSYGLVPLAAWMLGLLVGGDVMIGLILVASVPCTLASAILWTRMAGGNEATALLTVTGTTFTSWGLTTAWLYGLTETAVLLDPGAMMQDLVLSLILPVVVGQLLRRVPLGKQFADRRKVPLAVLAQFFVLAIVLKAGVTVGDRLHDQAAPMVFLWSIVLAVTLHLLALFGGLFSCRWLGFDRGRQIAVAFSASQKTLQVSLILYEQYFKVHYPFAVMPLLFYHVGQLVLDTIIARHLAKGGQPAPAEETPIYEFDI
jgi:sodium/bile acid cotransporter 7